MSIFFILQARLGSTRLPGKILLPFYNEQSILELLIKKLSSFIGCSIVVATSKSKINDRIEEIAFNNGVFCFRGSEDDVLQRFVDAAEFVGAQHIIRVCSDNPFLEVESIKRLIDFIKNNKGQFDYVSFDVNGSPSIKTHYGFWTEYVTLGALKNTVLMTSDPFYHEHVTNFIYGNPDLFRIKWLDIQTNLLRDKDIRLTIDTIEDFKTVQLIYQDLCEMTPQIRIEDVVSYLEIHPEHYSKMKSQIIINTK